MNEQRFKVIVEGHLARPPFSVKDYIKDFVKRGLFDEMRYETMTDNPTGGSGTL